MSLWDLNDKDLRKAAKAIKEESRALPDRMVRVRNFETAGPTTYLASKEKRLIEVWRSRHYLCQVFYVSEEVERLSINSSTIDTYNRRWRDGLTWDELSKVKEEVGRGDLDAIEFYPRTQHIVDVANIRHLWVFKKDMHFDFMWRCE